MSRARKVNDYLNSFFKEQLVDSCYSDINPLLEVALINGRYQLNAGKVNYSFGPLHDAFRKYFRIDPVNLNNTSKVLILGFGAGSVASILTNELLIKCNITGVEADEAVIEMARKHFFLDKYTDYRIIVADAHDYVMGTDEVFDLIVVDLYIDDKVPEKFETKNFLNACKKIMQPGARIVFNKLQPLYCTDDEAQALIKVFESVFDSTAYFELRVNKDSPNYFIKGTKDQ